MGWECWRRDKYRRGKKREMKWEGVRDEVGGGGRCGRGGR